VTTEPLNVGTRQLEEQPKTRNETRNLGIFGTQPGTQERWNLGMDEERRPRHSLLAGGVRQLSPRLLA
jgi:hypothetical protein